MSNTIKEEKHHEIPRKNWEDKGQYDAMQHRHKGIPGRRQRKFSKLWARLTAKIGRRISKKKIEEALHDNYDSIVPPPNTNPNDCGV